MPRNIINITSIPVSPVTSPTSNNPVISETFSLEIEKNTNNLEIVNNLHVENIEQDIDKRYVYSNDNIKK